MPNEFEIEADESGFVLVVSTTGGDLHRFGIPDGEAFYDHVKSMIGPWLYERDMAEKSRPVDVPSWAGGRSGYFDQDMARRPDADEYELATGGYALDDPKSEGYHERMSVAADDREGV